MNKENIKYEKGMRFKCPNKIIYEIVGWWNDAWVLAPKSKNESMCLLYEDSEITESLESGWQKVGAK